MIRLTSVIAQARTGIAPVARFFSSAAKGVSSAQRWSSTATALVGLGLLAVAMPSPASAVTTLYTIGDSTVAPYDAAHFPQSGWGEQLGFFFNSANVVVVDKAVGGTSSKSFYDSFWTPVKNSLKPGDFVTIQFGINDAAADAARHTVPFTTFTDYLKKFIAETRAKGAFPILISTQNRDSWTATTPPQPYPAYHDYPVAARQLAADTSINVPFVDLDQMCTAFRVQMGPFYTQHFVYLNTEPGEYSRFPDGHADSVHFQQAGAIEMARLVVTGIRQLSGNATIASKLIANLVPVNQVTFMANTSNGGVVTRTQSFPARMQVTAKALPNSGVKFTSWTGGLTGTKSTLQFTMGNSPLTIIANFSNGPINPGTGGSSTVFEAESATISPGVSESVNAGFSGSGYANTNNVVDAFVEWTVNVSTAGNYALDFRFANGTAVDRPADLRINGALVQAAISFPGTGAFTTWSDVTVTKALVAGTNKIRLTATTANGCANLDKLTVSR